MWCPLLLLLLLLSGEAADRPHLIVLLADDLGWNDVAFHGSRQIPTPHLDALAKGGVVLDRHYVCPVCSPSRAALLTGLHPIHTGLQHDVIFVDEPRGLPLAHVTLPQRLRRLGYVSHAVGKWHLGFFRKEYTPTFRGFDSHFGYWGGKEDYYDHTQELGLLWGLDLHEGLRSVTDALGNYSTSLFTERALRLIERHDTDKPLFLYLAYQAVHSGNSYAPLQAPPAYVERFRHIKNKQRRIFAGRL